MTRTMGLDYGDKKIGVAVSDELGWTAQGVTVIERKNETEVMRKISELVRQYDVSEIVVGLPKNMNGSIGPRGELSIAFADSLREALNLTVHLWDERLTTVFAERALLEADVSRKKRKQVVDRMAASLILQNFLDSKS